jgi:glycine/D-amino acid oxidase-like deaminating enzyme
MSVNQPARRIAIVGTGVIGASCAAYYRAREENAVLIGLLKPRSATST